MADGGRVSPGIVRECHLIEGCGRGPVLRIACSMSQSVESILRLIDFKVMKSHFEVYPEAKPFDRVGCVCG